MKANLILYYNIDISIINIEVALSSSTIWLIVVTN